MNFEDLLNSITPDIYANLKQAIEIGKWPNGDKLSVEQKESCLQAVIAYELKNVPEQERTGYIPPKPHVHCGGDGDIAEPEEKPLKWH